MEKRIKDSDLIGITKDDLIRFIPKEELIKLIHEKNEKHIENIKIPSSIFTTKLFPLESIVRYLKEKQNKKINEIAKTLNKNPSAISLAYKNSLTKKFIPKKTNIFIPLSEFQNNPKLSILEIIVNYFKNKNLKFSEIAKLLDRSPKTIWTLFNRGIKKQKEEVSRKDKRKRMKGGKND